jgi:hypothetical protein
MASAEKARGTESFLRVKWRTALGGIYGGGSFNIKIPLRFYLANIAASRWAGRVVMYRPPMDAISDPLMGSSRTHEDPLGRRKPYFIVASSQLVLSMTGSVSATTTTCAQGGLREAANSSTTPSNLVMCPTCPWRPRSDGLLRAQLGETVRMIFSLASYLMCAILPLPS